MKAEAQRRVTLIDVEFLEPLLPLESTKDDNFKAAWNNTLHAINDTARCEAILSGPHLDNSRKVTILICKCLALLTLTSVILMVKQCGTFIQPTLHSSAVRVRTPYLYID